MSVRKIADFETKTSQENVDFNEEQGIVSGFIATTHPDNSPEEDKDGDILTVSVLQKIVDKINSTRPQDRHAKAVSVEHDHFYENTQKPAAGTTIRAELRDMDEGHKGVWVEDQLDKHYSSTVQGNPVDYNTVVDRIKTKMYPGFSIEFNGAQGTYEKRGDKTYRIVNDLNYCGHGFGGIRDLANDFAEIDGLKTNSVFKKDKEEKKTNNNIKAVKKMADDAKKDDAPKEEAPVEEKKEEEVKEEVKEEVVEENKTVDVSKQLKDMEVKMLGSIKDTIAAEVKALPNMNAPMVNTAKTDKAEEVKEVSNYFNALEKGTTAAKTRAANALVSKYPGIEARSKASGMLISDRKTKGNWGVDIESGLGFECKTNRASVIADMEVKALTTTTNAEATYYQASAELNDVYDPVIYSHINDQVTTYNLLQKDDASGAQKIQFRVITSGPTAELYEEGDSTWTATNSTRIKLEQDFAYIRSIVEVTGQMIADATGPSGIGDVYGQEVRRASIELVRTINSTLLTGSDATYDGAGGSANGRLLGFQHLLDDDTGDNLYGKSRNTYSTLCSAGDDALGTKNFTLHKLRSILTSCEENGANRGDMVYIMPPQQRDKFLQILQTMGIQQQPRAGAIAGFAGMTYELDGIPIWVDKDMTSTDIFLIDRENTRLSIQVAPTMTEFGITGDTRKAFIKMYFNLYSRKPNHNYRLTGVKAT